MDLFPWNIWILINVGYFPLSNVRNVFNNNNFLYFINKRCSIWTSFFFCHVCSRTHANRKRDKQRRGTSRIQLQLLVIRNYRVYKKLRPIARFISNKYTAVIMIAIVGFCMIKLCTVRCFFWIDFIPSNNLMIRIKKHQFSYNEPFLIKFVQSKFISLMSLY
jgi:hypothetical protein